MSVVFNADDFGSSSSVNTAIVRAHREGILTSASLMVRGPAAAEAVALAQASSGLAVGLHLTLAGGWSALSHRELPHITDSGGCLPLSPARAGLLYSISRAARRELCLEIAAQFRLFEETGLPLSHVDGHMHLHLLPAALPEVLRQIERLPRSAAPSRPAWRDQGSVRLRIPRDSLWLALRHDKNALGLKLGWSITFGVLGRWAAAGGLPGVVTPDLVFGFMQSGRMTEGYVVDALDAVRRRARARPGLLVEFYFHPDLGPGAERFGPNPGDLATLLSPRVREALARVGTSPRAGAPPRAGIDAVEENGGDRGDVA